MGLGKLKIVLKVYLKFKLLYIYNKTTMKRIVSNDEDFEVLPPDNHGFDHDDEDGI
jgi:hypothetical protein